MQPARHQIITGAAGRALEEDGRLDLDEVARVEPVAHELDHAMAQQNVARHAWPAQVEVAIAQAERLLDGDFLVDDKGRCLSGVENLKRTRAQLDGPRGQMGVLLARQPSGHVAGDGEDILVAHLPRVLPRGHRIL